MIDLTPDQFRTLGYRAVDLIAEQLAALPAAPCRPTLPDALRQSLLDQPLPAAGRDADQVLDAVAEYVLPYPMGNNSPRFFAWVNSPAAPLGVLAELLAGGLNASVAGGLDGGTFVEPAGLGLVQDLLGFPSTSGGLLASGGSMANLIGLAAMRFVKAQGAIRASGFLGQ